MYNITKKLKYIHNTFLYLSYHSIILMLEEPIHESEHYIVIWIFCVKFMGSLWAVHGQFMGSSWANSVTISFIDSSATIPAFPVIIIIVIVVSKKGWSFECSHHTYENNNHSHYHDVPHNAANTTAQGDAVEGPDRVLVLR